MDIPLEKVASGLGEPCPLGKAARVGDHQLEHVSPGLNVDAKPEHVFIGIGIEHIEAMVILCCQSHAPAHLQSSTDTKRELVVVLDGLVYPVAVYHSGH